MSRYIKIIRQRRNMRQTIPKERVLTGLEFSLTPGEYMFTIFEL
jgi:hypothetical protein